MTRVILGDIAISQTGPFGSQLHEEDYVSEGTPIVTVEHLGDTNFTHQNLPFISEADTKRLSKYILIEGDIVFSRVGSIDRNVYVDKNHEGWMFSGRCIRVRADKNKVNPRYLSYYFKQNSFKKMMMNLAVGATMPSLNTKIMNSIELDLLPRESQDKIANILSAIDDKIQINNQINQELEAMAKTLYDYWFVQFDFPDQNGNPYKSSGGKMVYHPELKREIPEGWGVEKLGDVAYLKAGGDKPSNISEIQSKETPFPIYSNGLDNKGLYGYTNKATIHKKSLTVSARGTIGYIQRRFSSFFPIIRLISVTPKEEKMIGYIENFLKSIQFENSGSVQRQLTVPQIDKLYILVPKNEVLKKYHSMTINYYFEVENNEQQNQELIQLRDWLLPMLMNGQVKVE
ncbi:MULTISPECIES: restriction endonuclease subunit S [Streptococcus]|nr:MULTISPECIES: restriction endonuclease subunit S [Streptococcus]KYF36026.1 Type I restriction-modification system, specificity subunit S [Streptococcus mitis]MBT2165048.1 restriction endonuclease subunit S [Streptococcus mitis]OFN98182.1 hypothetical protein HMPREF2701_01315 [Streptococcus sp. HMSC077D04]